MKMRRKLVDASWIGTWKLLLSLLPDLRISPGWGFFRGFSLWATASFGKSYTSSYFNLFDSFIKFEKYSCEVSHARIMFLQGSIYMKERKASENLSFLSVNQKVKTFTSN